MFSKTVLLGKQLLEPTKQGQQSQIVNISTYFWITMILVVPVFPIPY